MAEEESQRLKSITHTERERNCIKNRISFISLQKLQKPLGNDKYNAGIK